MTHGLRHGWMVLLLLCAVASAQPGRSAAIAEAPVYVEDSPAAQEMIEQAQHLRRQERLGEAAIVFQQVTEQYPLRLMLQDGIYTDTARWVRREMAGSTELLTAYRRAHEALAERALDEAGSDPDGLSSVMERYALTRAGFEAAMRLAALSMERARFNDAASVLEDLLEHPDQAGEAPRWHLLQAAVGLFGDQPQRLQEHRAALEETGRTREMATLEAWAAQAAPPHVPPTLDPLTPAAVTQLPQAVEMPLWTLDMPATERDVAQDILPAMPGQSEGAPASHILPVVAGNHLYLNAGAALLAVDRHSGRPLWTFAAEEYNSLKAAMTHQMRRSLPDERGVAVDDQRVVAVVGEATNWPGRWRQQAQDTTLACFRAGDGQLLWRVGPEELDEAWDNALFHGTPIIAQGRVYALVRRSRMSDFHRAFIVALELESGKMVWRRHLASVVAAQRSVVRPLSQMLLEGHRLYVVTNLGAVACLDARSGAALWVHTGGGLPSALVGGFAHSNATPPPWQVSPPVLVAAGLIVPPLDRTRPAILLDPQTGRKLRDLEASLWGQGDYYMPAQGDVLVLGETVRRIDGATLELRWTRSLGPAGEAQLRGRAAVTASHVLLPQRERIVILDLATGQVAARHAVEAPGNLLALEEQLLVAAQAATRCYMSWSAAQASLTQQMEQQPRDPRPALALAYLALRAGQTQAMLQGVDRALEAVQFRRTAAGRGAAGLADPLQREAFAQVLRFVEPGLLPDTAARAAVFERLARLTATSADEVAYQLALGQFLVETGRHQEAADHYQAVLGDATLAEQLYQASNTSRQASIEAKLRLERLIEQHGAQVYARHEAEAAQRLAEQLDAPFPDPQKLLEIARRYPVSRSATGALVAAGEAFTAAGDLSAATTQFRRAYDQTRDPALLAQVLGRLVELYDRQGQPRRARQWLQYARHRDVQPLRAGRPVSVEQWLAELGRQPSPGAPGPTLALPLRQPWALPGRLLTPVSQPAMAWSDEVILTAAGATLHLRRAPSFDPVWEATVPDGPVTLLSLTDEQVLLWLDQSNALLALDAATGRPMWPALAVAPLIEQIGGEAQRQAARPIEQRRLLEQWGGRIVMRNGQFQLAEPLKTGFLVATNDTVACVVDRLGRALGVDRRSGRILWRVLGAVEQVNDIRIADDHLAIGGVAGWLTNAPSGALLLLDPLSGEARRPVIEDPQPVTWVGFGGEGLLLYATQNQVLAHYLGDGKLAWRLSIEGKPLSGFGVADLDVLLLQDAEGALLVIDPVAGQVRQQVHAPAVDRGRNLSLQPAGQQWHVLTPSQALALEADGTLLWRDAIQPADKELVLQLPGDEVVAVLSLPGQGVTGRHPGVMAPLHVQAEVLPNLPVAPLPHDEARPPAPEGWVYELFLLERRGGGILHQRKLGPLREPIDASSAVFLPNHLILTTSSATVVIPGAE